MNAATLTVNQLCGAFTAPTGRFRSLNSVKAFLFSLNGNLPIARSIIGRLRDETKGGAVLTLWLKRILKELEALSRRKREHRRERERIALEAHVASREQVAQVDDGDVVRPEVFGGRRGELSCLEWASA
jgi:hypothetical protein